MISNDALCGRAALQINLHILYSCNFAHSASTCATDIVLHAHAIARLQSLGNISTHLQTLVRHTMCEAAEVSEPSGPLPVVPDDVAGAARHDQTSHSDIRFRGYAIYGKI